jgi:ketopantoate reductase
MKYLIIGTGGTGSSIGGFLALAGNDVKRTNFRSFYSHWVNT